MSHPTPAAHRGIHMEPVTCHNLVILCKRVLMMQPQGHWNSKGLHGTFAAMQCVCACVSRQRCARAPPCVCVRTLDTTDMSASAPMRNLDITDTSNRKTLDITCTSTTNAYGTSRTSWCLAMCAQFCVIEGPPQTTAIPLEIPGWTSLTPRTSLSCQCVRHLRAQVEKRRHPPR